jgi:hypothetical protein
VFDLAVVVTDVSVSEHSSGVSRRVVATPRPAALPTKHTPT